MGSVGSLAALPITELRLVVGARESVMPAAILKRFGAKRCRLTSLGLSGPCNFGFACLGFLASILPSRLRKLSIGTVDVRTMPTLPQLEELIMRGPIPEPAANCPAVAVTEREWSTLWTRLPALRRVHLI